MKKKIPKVRVKNPNNARPGNNSAQKLTTSKLKKMAYEQYCAHLAKGKSKRSWCFEHPDLTLTFETMEKYILNDREFAPLQKKIAEIKGYYVWEQVVEDSARGVNKDANTASLQMLMRNKFGWDKENSLQKDTAEPLVKRLAKKWRGN